MLLALVTLRVQVWPHLDARRTSFPGYWLVAREVWSGTPARTLYDDDWLAARMQEEGFSPDRMLGPPALALTASPVAALPYPAARRVWMLAFLWPALAGSVWWLCRRLPPLTGLLLGAALLLSRPVEAGMEVAQVYPLLLVAHCGALHAWERGRDRGALWLSPLLLLRGWHGLPQTVGWLRSGAWRGAAWAVGGAIAGALLTLPLLGLDAWLHFLFVQSREVGDSPDAFVLAYQTWRSLALHVTTFDPLRSPAPPLAGLGRSLWLGGVAVILAVAFAAGGRARPGTGGLGFALWTCVALLLAPFAEDHHFVLIALPAVVLWAEAPHLRALVGLSLVLLLPSWGFDDPELSGGWRALLAYPRVWGTLLLFLGCALAVLRPRNSASAPAS